jgi:hypothetical protein
MTLKQRQKLPRVCSYPQRLPVTLVEDYTFSVTIIYSKMHKIFLTRKTSPGKGEHFFQCQEQEGRLEE